MKFRILGSLEAGADGAVAELGPPKQRALLAILVMHAGEIVATDRLIDLLWGDRPPRTALHSIQIYVSELRKALDPLAGRQVIETRPPGYQLHAVPDSIDAVQFETLVADGIRLVGDGDWAGGTAALRAALALWRGPALSDFTYEEFAQETIRRLHDAHLDAIEELAGAELDSGRTSDVLPLLNAAIRDDPLRERSREMLMLALYRSGRHAEALRTYQNLRTLLDEELGLDPSPPLQRLQERILLHDPTLLPAAEAAPISRTARNPYKGLRPFLEEDAADFFGRDALLDRLVESIRDGARLIALVGPSGSGKSSVVAAGLVPRLRAGALAGSDRWVIAQMIPGAHPFEDVEAVLANAADVPIGLEHLIDRGADQGAPGGLRILPDGGRLLLVIDQFEELFTATEDGLRRRFLHALAATVTEPHGQVVVVLTLRADFYDRPLLHAEFAEAFIPGVINVLPMKADELEAAIITPAERVGVLLQPALLAELVAETADQPGALPLLQYALTELFEQRTGSTLTLAGYRALGGLRGVLSRRAESIYGDLGPTEQLVAKQMFLRLVRLGRGTVDSRRRLAVRDLTGLDLDPVALSAVLAVFGRHRLLSFDRDPVTGDAVIEVAHEALFREWDRLASWIDVHRAALRRRDTLTGAAEEWELAGRNDDYLVSGTRLTELEALRQEGALQLTSTEKEFLETALARRQADRQLDDARRADHRRLERRARVRLVALIAVLVMFGGAVAYGSVALTGHGPPRVAIVHPALNIAVINLLDAGFDAGVAKFGMLGTKRLADLDKSGGSLEELASDGTDLIVLFSGFDTDLAAIARAHPGTRFVVFDSAVQAPNVAYVDFAVQDASFLAGAAAALQSRTGTIGFVGGVDAGIVWRFEAGYEAGARAVDPQIRILVRYLSTPPDYGGGFQNPDGGERAARTQYTSGADVVFAAAGTSETGVFQAAADVLSAGAAQRWAIGTDVDQFLAVEGQANGTSWQPHILTSVLKRSDTAVYAILDEFSRGVFNAGIRPVGLASGGVDLSYSGGFIDGIRPHLDDLRAKIVAGTIQVPCVTSDQRSRAEEAGQALEFCQP
jgi:basic membrane lipoprotein Med (substrate-binding protein (PBP1-ABC) superfamily)/DNA-binding SARP family transcriptional activator